LIEWALLVFTFKGGTESSVNVSLEQFSTSHNEGFLLIGWKRVFDRPEDSSKSLLQECPISSEIDIVAKLNKRKGAEGFLRGVRDYSRRFSYAAGEFREGYGDAFQGTSNPFSLNRVTQDARKVEFRADFGGSLVVDMIQRQHHEMKEVRGCQPHFGLEGG